MKLISENQLIGTSPGCAVFRNLYEKENGERVSVRTSREFWIQLERTLPDGRLTNYPPESVMLKHRLP